MKYQKLCDEIITKVGGRDNVLDVSHCITRLRFHLKDESLAQTNELKATKGVVDVIQAGGQYQVVIGATVEAVYNDLVQIGGFDSKPALDIDEGDDVKKGDPFSRLLAIISEILQPVLGVLMAGGFIKSMLALCTVAGWLAKDSNTYVTLSAIGDSVFYYFPLIIGWTSAKKFGLKPVMGMALGGILVYPTLVALMGGDPLYTLGAGTVFESNVYGDIFGIPLIMQNYSSTILPAIFIVWIASKVHKALSNALPALVSSFFSNILTLLICGILGLLVVGPVMTVLSNIVCPDYLDAHQLPARHRRLRHRHVLEPARHTRACTGVSSRCGFSMSQPTAMTSLTRSCMQAVVPSPVLCLAWSSEPRTPRKMLPSTFPPLSQFPVSTSLRFYAILLPRKRLMWATFISAGVGGAIAGLMGAKLYAFGASSPLGFPSFINPARHRHGLYRPCHLRCGRFRSRSFRRYGDRYQEGRGR